jgi:hypothetical protein
VTYVDTKADPAEAVRAATQLVQQDRVDVLVGAVLSPVPRRQERAEARRRLFASTGCATVDFSGKSCNKYSFRVHSAGPMTIGPLAKYLTQTHGKRWAIIYPDYAFGQSQLAAYTAAIEQQGGPSSPRSRCRWARRHDAVHIQDPAGRLGGRSGQLLIGTDLARATAVMEQFGSTSGCRWSAPAAGSSAASIRNLSPGRSLSSRARPTRCRTTRSTRTSSLPGRRRPRIGNLVDALGGADKAVPGDLGNFAWGAMMALKNGMIAAKLTGRADTEVVAALENASLPQGPDFRRARSS